MRWNGFCGPSYTPASILTAYDETYNWYVETAQSPYVKGPSSLYPTPGFLNRGNTGYTMCRGMETVNNVTLAVFDDQIGQINYISTNGALTFTPYGTVVNDGNPASIAFNGLLGNQALIVSGFHAYCLNLGTHALVEVLQFAEENLLQVGMLDGFFIVFGGGSTGTRIWVSAIYDGTSWDPTQFLQRSDQPDNWSSMLVLPPDCWLIGEQSGCILYDSGSFPFPLALRPGMESRFGCLAPWTLKGAGYSVLWMMQTKEGGAMVMRSQGYQPMRVSTYAVEHDLATTGTNLSNSEALMYQSMGHTFYCLTVPEAERTWVYDLEANTWHKRGLWQPGANQYQRWRPRCATQNFGMHIVGEWATGILSQMSESFATERDGMVIRRLRRAPGMFSERRNVPIQSVDVYLESGTSNATPPADDAQIIWRNSDDGGRTWPVERMEPIGRIGDYSAMVRMWGHGCPRDRVSELIVSDPITSWRVTDVFVNNHAPGGRA